MSIFNNIKIKDAHLNYLLNMKNMMNAGFLSMNKTEYDDLVSFDSFFLEQHEYYLRDKSKKDLENKRKEEEMRMNFKSNKRSRIIMSG